MVTETECTIWLVPTSSPSIIEIQFIPNTSFIMKQIYQIMMESDFEDVSPEPRSAQSRK